MRHSFTPVHGEPGYYFAMVDSEEHCYLVRGKGPHAQIKLKATSPTDAAKNLRQRMEIGSVQVIIDDAG